MMAAAPKDLALRKTGDEFYKSADIEIRTNSEVVRIDSTSSTVETQNGELVSYDYLVLASGGNPRTLDIAKDVPNVYRLRTPDDGNTIGIISDNLVIFNPNHTGSII